MAAAYRHWRTTFPQEELAISGGHIALPDEEEVAPRRANGLVRVLTLCA